MKEFTTRAIFGILYAAVVICGLFFHPYGLLALLVIIYVLGLQEMKHLVQLSQEKTLFLSATVLGTIFLWAHMSFLLVYRDFLMPLLALFLTILIIHHLFLPNSEKDSSRVSRMIFAVLYLFLPTALALSISLSNGVFEPRYLLSIFFFLWASDTFAYLSGMAIGRHKLIPRLSPKKSIEGFIGGILGSILISVFLHWWWPNLFSLTQWILFASITAIFGTIGDLLESSLKRSAGVKDASNLIPGHGGILDRLDSFLLSVPILYFCLRFFIQ